MQDYIPNIASKDRAILLLQDKLKEAESVIQKLKVENARLRRTIDRLEDELAQDNHKGYSEDQYQTGAEH